MMSQARRLQDWPAHFLCAMYTKPKKNNDSVQSVTRHVLLSILAGNRAHHVPAHRSADIVG